MLDTRCPIGCLSVAGIPKVLPEALRTKAPPQPRAKARKPSRHSLRERCRARCTAPGSARSSGSCSVSASRCASSPDWSTTCRSTPRGGFTSPPTRPTCTASTKGCTFSPASPRSRSCSPSSGSSGPNCWSGRPFNGALHALERLSLIPLVGGSLFLLFTGVVNIDYWYSPMAFTFTTAHFWTAWLVVGALVIHIGAKAATVRDRNSVPHRPPAPGAPREAAKDVEPPCSQCRSPTRPDRPRPGPARIPRRGPRHGGLFWLRSPSARRSRPLRRLAVLAPRNPSVGPQHVSGQPDRSPGRRRRNGRVDRGLPT